MNFGIMALGTQKSKTIKKMSQKIYDRFQKLQIVNKLRSATLFATVIVLLGAGAIAVHADQYDDQINQLKQQNANNQNGVAGLQVQADGYQGQINLLQQQVNTLQSQITANQAEQASLASQITANEQAITLKKAQLAADIKAMYISGQLSSIEELASSSNLSHYVDAQEDHAIVQQQLDTKLNDINALQAKLQAQKLQVDQLVRDQTAMQAQLSAQQADQVRLLALTQDQQNTLNQQINSNNSAIAGLRAAQAAANRRKSGGARVVAGDPNHGGYPAYLSNAYQDSQVDPWGMYNRECVSYTAWKVYQTYGHMPYWGGSGNANQWPSNAQADGIATGTTPRKNSVAIWYVGNFGHAMWVEDVYDNGTMLVSQYNYDYTGHYSEMTVSTAGTTFIYFN